MHLRRVPWIAAIFYGLKPAVMAIVAAAVIRIGKALKNEVMWTVAAVAFVAIFFLKVPFPVIVSGRGSSDFSVDDSSSPGEVSSAPAMARKRAHSD